MAYNPYNPMPWGFQPAVNQSPYQTTTILPQQEVLRINGRNGAEALNMAPNSSVLALDTSAPIVWLIQTDGAGYKTPTPYEIKPYEQQQPVNVSAGIENLEKRISALEAIINGQSNSGANGRRANKSNGNSGKSNESD